VKIKIDFIAPPFSGHLNPLIELAYPLLSKGDYIIRFITGPNKINFLRELGFNSISILSKTPSKIESIVDTDKAVKCNFFSLLEQLRQLISLSPEIIKDLEEEIRKNKTDIVVADFVAIHAGIVCEKINLPWITSIPTPFAIETNFGTPSYFGGLDYSESLYSKTRDYLARKIIRLFKILVEIVFKKELKKINYSIYRKNGTESAYSPYSILGLGVKEFEFKRDWPSCFKFIGPCCSTPDPKLVPFDVLGVLNKKSYKKYILVTLGTHLEWAKSTLTKDVGFIAKEFEDICFVISYGRREKASKKPVYTKKNVIIQEYISYTKDLERFDAVIHHGGAGITYACIKHKKPSIVVPHDYDQFDFAARIKHFNLGYRVKKLKSKETILALKQLFSNSSFNLDKINQSMKKYVPSLSLEKEILRLCKAKKAKL